MQKILILVLLLLAYKLTAQTEPKAIVLKNGTVIKTYSRFFSFEDHIYFREKGNAIKIHKDSIENKLSYLVQIKSDKISYYLYKFASESQTGIGLQVLGTALGVGLSFANVSPIVYLTLPPAISLTGFIIWGSSYRHLKKFHLISEAKDYFTTP